jgi:hypothetical protein
MILPRVSPKNMLRVPHVLRWGAYTNLTQIFRDPETGSLATVTLVVIFGWRGLIFPTQSTKT